MAKHRMRAAAAIALLSVPGAAGAQEATTMFWVYQEHVRPAMVAEYEDATRDLVGLFESAGEAAASVSWTTISSMETGYFFAIPIESFGGIDETWQAWMGAVEAAGRENFDRIDERVNESLDRASSFVIALRPDLSYLPETVSLDSELPYRKYYWWYITPGLEEEFESAAKSFIDLYRSHGIETGWRIYQFVMGDDMPAYLVVDRAAGPYEYEARDRETMEKLGAEAQALGARAMKTARRMEITDGWVRPELSFPQGR